METNQTIITMTKVSIIVPIYNKALYLNDAFDSFDNQTYGNIEWVLVDDGSTDMSRSIMEKWIPKCGSKVLVAKTNGGAASARNAGFEASSGEYVAFWDPDAQQDPHAIQMLVDSFSDQADIIICAIQHIDQRRRKSILYSHKSQIISSRRALQMWLTGNLSTAPYSKMIKRKVLDAYRIRFDEKVRINEDSLWTCDLFLHCSNVQLIPTPLYCYIARDGSLSRSINNNIVEVYENCLIIENKVESIYPDFHSFVRQYSAGACWNIIKVSFRGKNRRLYPFLYKKSLDEYRMRKIDICKYRRSVKDLIIRLLIRLHVYQLFF